MFMIIAHGANDLQIPCRFSEEKTTLKKFMKKAFPKCKWEKDEIFVEECEDYESDEDEEDEGCHPGFLKVFEGYYDGCGGVWKFEIKEVKLDEKILGWDLD